MTVFLRDLFLRRKPIPEIENPEAALALLEAAAGITMKTSAPSAAAPSAADPETAEQPSVEAAAPTRCDVLQLEPFLDAPAPVMAGNLSQDAIARRHATVLRRITALTLSGQEAAELRQDAILDRLCIVHDPNEVVVTGPDRVARILMVNRRLMSARFSLPGRVDEVFSFQKKRASKRAAKDLCASLAGFCAEPVDLVVTERPMAGVFDAAAGLAIADLLSVQSGAIAFETLDEADLPEDVAG